MAEARVERRLTAIFAGDVAGYSRLMGVDEEGTLARLNAHRREFLEPKIADHRGRIVKRTGDGILIEFASAVDAARCAIEIQRGMIKRNASVPQDNRIEFRIGYVLEGSVRKAADRVRVTGQLIDAETGAHVWVERYDRKVDDIFALQDDITLSV